MSRRGSGDATAADPAVPRDGVTAPDGLESTPTILDEGRVEVRDDPADNRVDGRADVSPGEGRAGDTEIIPEIVGGDDAAHTEEPGRSDERPGRSGAVAMASATVLVVLLLAGAVVAGVLWSGGHAEESDRDAALGAARQAAVNLTSIDFNTAEQDVRRILDGSTGDFGSLFTQNLDSYVGVVRDGEVVTTGEVAEAGIEKYDGETATALVAVKTEVRNKTVPNGEQRFYRLVEHMEKHDGEWLVAQVEFVP